MLEHAGRPWSGSYRTVSPNGDKLAYSMTITHTFMLNSRSSRTLQKNRSGSLTDLNLPCKQNGCRDSDLSDYHSLSDSEVPFYPSNYSSYDREPHNQKQVDVLRNADAIPAKKNRSSDSYTSSTDTSSRTSETSSPTFYKLSKKKRVSFADEKGHSLTDVRTMVNSDDEDDLVSDARVSKYATTVLSKWSIHFPIPATQYITFRERLESKFVSLENIFINSNCMSFTGTVKVKNISYEKRVFVRITWDNWVTYRDFTATYQPSGESHSRFDTFVFQIDLPDNCYASKVQLAACFDNCMGEQYWDNNDGQNYVLTRETVPEPHHPLPYTYDCKPNFDIFDSFTDYRAWHHFSTETNYY